LKIGLRPSQELEGIRGNHQPGSGLMDTIDDDKKDRKLRELNYKIMQFNISRKKTVESGRFPEYEEKFYCKVARARRSNRE
jgi:hypothetical protein